IANPPPSTTTRPGQRTIRWYIVARPVTAGARGATGRDAVHHLRCDPNAALARLLTKVGASGPSHREIRSLSGRPTAAVVRPRRLRPCALRHNGISVSKGYDGHQ